MRKVAQTQSFADQAAELETHVPRVRDFLRALNHKLRRNPEFGTKVKDDPPVWFSPMPDVVRYPLCVAYTFDDDSVLLLGIWVSEGSADL